MTIRVSYEALKAEFKRVLLARKVKEETAEACATVFADTTQAGIYSHGGFRFLYLYCSYWHQDSTFGSQPRY